MGYKIRVTEVVTETLEEAVAFLSLINKQQLPSVQLGASVTATAQPPSSSQEATPAFNGGGVSADELKRVKDFIAALSKSGRMVLGHLAHASAPVATPKLGKAMGWKSGRGTGSVLKKMKEIAESYKLPLPVEISQESEEQYARWQLRPELKPLIQQALTQ
jgi:hypothetical protein